jgi:hypothetical protein
MSFVKWGWVDGKGSHFVIIHKKGYGEWEWYIEIGFSAMTTPDYFLWINLKEVKSQYLIEKYNLKPVK